MTQSNKRAPASQQRRPVSAKAAPVRGGGFKGDLLKLIIIGAAVVALALLLQCLWPNGFPVRRQEKNELAAEILVSEIFSDGPLRINEVMTSNRNTITMDDDQSPDWIEIMNIGSKAVKLGGYTLSKTAEDVRIFTFPEMTLDAGKCVLVFADSRLRTTAGEDLHAPFRLSSAGDTLMLFNAGGSAIDTVNIEPLQSDQSYAREDTYTWQICDLPTPGLGNTRENYLALKQPAGDSPVVLSEIVSTNASAYTDENGQYHDYIELYNRSGASVNLSGWYLSDDEAELRKWRMPEVVLEPDQCLVVHASKLDRKQDPAHLHTNFGLSSEGETALLVSPEGRIMDRVDFGLLKADVAMTLNADGSWGTSTPTPGTHH